METRLICLPRKPVKALRHQATDDLKCDEHEQTDASDSACSKPYISDGDILSAWGAITIDRGLGKRRRALTVMNVFDMRSRLGSLFDHSTAYVQNAISVATTMFKANESQTLSLGQIALRLRSSLVVQTSEPQIKALVREQKASIRDTGRLALFADPHSILLPISNFGKANFYEIVDLSPAVVRAGRLPQGNNQGPVGKPVLFFGFDASPKAKPTHRNVFSIRGKDLRGNHWIQGMLSPVTWVHIEEELSKL